MREPWLDECWSVRECVSYAWVNAWVDVGQCVDSWLDVGQCVSHGWMNVGQCVGHGWMNVDKSPVIYGFFAVTILVIHIHAYVLSAPGEIKEEFKCN